MAVALLLCTGLPGWAEMLPIKNDSTWLDTGGKEIAAQGGSMMKLGDTYYWYGFDGEIPVPKSGIPMYQGVNCYSSKDLSRWKFESAIFKDAGKVPNRLDVVFCPATKKYVMLSKHMDFKKGVGISTCDTPAGNFEWQGWMELPDSMGGGDQSVFVDDDGKAYITYTPWRMDPANNKVETNRHLTIAELTPDFLKVARVVCQLRDTKLEAPAIFKRDGKYYWMASQVAWWYSSATSWCMASKLEGPWTPMKKLESGLPATHPLAKQMLADSYNSQHDFVVEVKGTAGKFYMYCGDRYQNYMTYGVGRVVWLPLQFHGDVPCLDWHQTWDVDAEKGTWSAK